MIFTRQEPRWSIYADRILALCGIVGSIILIAILCYEWGAADQREAMPKCEKKVINRMDWYSPDELRRIARMRERLEKVK